MTKLNQLQLIAALYSDDDDSQSDNEKINVNLVDPIKESTANKDNEKINSSNLIGDEKMAVISSVDPIRKSMGNQDNEKCSICLSTSFKYKCPSCLAKTCSLDCFKRHKDQLECTGLRDSLKFKRLANFNDDQLRDDFKFLEDYNRQMDGIKRQKRNIVQSLQELPNWLKKLKYEANRRSINLKILPAGFKRRLENKTTFMYSSKQIYWDIEIVFKDLNLKEKESLQTKDTKQITFHIERVPETHKLINLLANYIKPNSLIDNLHLNSLLKHYQNANDDELAYLIKLSFNHYLELNSECTINECLKNKTVIEFPTIIVILKKNLVNYNLVKEDNLRSTMCQYSNKSYELLTKFNPFRKDFKSRNNKQNRSSKEQVEEVKKNDESNKIIEKSKDGEKDEEKDESDSEEEEDECEEVGDEEEVEDEESDDEPLEMKTKFTFDNSLNENFN